MSSQVELKALKTIAGRELPKNVFNTILISKDQQMAADEYTASISISLNDGDGAAVTGRINELIYVSHVVAGGTGAVNKPVGTLHFFRADPMVAARAAALGANGVDHLNIIGTIKLKAEDWVADASGAAATILIDVPFRDLTDIFCVFHNDSGSAAFNSLAAEDEVLKLTIGFTNGRN